MADFINVFELAEPNTFVYNVPAQTITIASTSITSAQVQFKATTAYEVLYSPIFYLTVKNHPCSTPTPTTTLTTFQAF